MFYPATPPRPRAFLLALALFIATPLARAESPRFVVDDEAFLDQVCAAALKLKDAGRLVPLETLQCQLNRQFTAVRPAPEAEQKFSPPDLYERLLQSTLAVGDFYQCDACTNWHFNAATAFVVASNGVLCTSFHVIGNGEEAALGKPDFLVAADREGHVYPVREVLAADAEADTCLLKIDATGLTPLPLRTSARTGERVYCLGHPEGNHFLFSEGIVARLMRSREVMSAFEPDGQRTTRARPTLYVNVTAEFSPGSSGGPIVDEAGNVLAQVQSIANNVESDGTTNTEGMFVGGPVRYCVAAEEILRLTQPPAGYRAPAPLAKPAGFQPSAALSEAELLELTRSLFSRGTNALLGMDAPLIGGTLFRRFDTCVKVYTTRFPANTNHSELDLLQLRAYRLREEHHVPQAVEAPETLAQAILDDPRSTTEQKTAASRERLLLSAGQVEDLDRLATWEKALQQHNASFSGDAELVELEMEHLALVEEFAPGRLVPLAKRLAASKDAAVATAAKDKLDELKPLANPRRNRAE